VNPRREASERVHGAYEVRVLEPSPPPVTDRLWFADDPVARGESPAGAPIVSPVTTGDLTWDELCRDAPELAGWCADRWLGAWRPLPPLPARDAFAPTRAAWHTLAEHVLARARYDANGKIGLRYTRRGVGTPWFRHHDRDAQVRIEGTNLVVHEDGETRSAPLTTVAAAAELARIQPGAPEEVYAPATTLERDAPLVLDARSVEFFGAWFGFAASVLEQIRAEADPVDEPSRVQLWPEHFDLSVDLGDENAGHRGTFGASPGDDVDRDPYLYVTHWADVGADDYWDEEHFPGASLTVVSLAAAPDQRASALTFLRRGRDLLRGL
jgi:hypothetical protein